MRVEFNEQRHSYTLWDGGYQRPLKSATQIMKIQHAPALEQWKLNQVAEYAVAYKDDWAGLPQDDAYELLRNQVYWKSKRAANRGTEGHIDVEAMLVDGMEPVGYAAAAAKFQTDLGLAIMPTEVERIIVDPVFGYAGTADVLQERLVVDWKTKPDTSKLLYPNQGLQLAAYGMASHVANKVTGELTKKAAAYVGYMVALYPNGTYRAWKVDLYSGPWYEAWVSMVTLDQVQPALQEAWVPLHE